MKNQLVLFLILFFGSSTYGMSKDSSCLDEHCIEQHTTYKELNKNNVTCDLRLDPLKGETLWREPKQIIFIKGYLKPFKVPGELEVTLSPMAWPGACNLLYRGLEEYGVEKIGYRIQERLLCHPISFDAAASIYQESVFVRLDKSLPEFGVKKTMAYLKDLEKSAYSHGALRSFIWVHVKTDQAAIKYQTNKLRKRLYLCGYEYKGSVYEVRQESLRYLYSREFKPHEFQQTQTPASSWQWQIRAEEPEQSFKDKFGVFLRKKGHIKGGVFGAIRSQTSTPHGFVDIFWLDDKRKGKGLGSKVFNFALTHLKERKVSVIDLETADYQAPWFYEKMGFKKVMTIPGCVRTKDGKLNNVYFYRKEVE